MLLALRSLFESSGSDVTVNLTGVAASPAIGSAFRIDVDFAISGVAASPAIGAGTFDVTDPITGVFGSAAIGVGSFNADFSISGVVADAAVGATQIDVDFAIIGVAASPAIGEGVVTGADTVVTEVSPGGAIFIRPARRRRPIIVFSAKGAAAKPRIGEGEVAIEIGGSNAPSLDVKTIPRGARNPPAPRVDIAFPIVAAGVSPAIGAAGTAASTAVKIDSIFHIPDSPFRVPISEVGCGKTISIVDLTDEEMMVLLMAA